jgi:hypothetical protein
MGLGKFHLWADTMVSVIITMIRDHYVLQYFDIDVADSYSVTGLGSSVIECLLHNRELVSLIECLFHNR